MGGLTATSRLSWDAAGIGLNVSVCRWGEALLDADTERIAEVYALGLDEILLWRRGRFRTKAWATDIVDVGRSLPLASIAPATTLKANIAPHYAPHFDPSRPSRGRREIGKHRGQSGAALGVRNAYCPI